VGVGVGAGAADGRARRRMVVSYVWGRRAAQAKGRDFRLAGWLPEHHHDHVHYRDRDRYHCHCHYHDAQAASLSKTARPARRAGRDWVKRAIASAAVGTRAQHEPGSGRRPVRRLVRRDGRGGAPASYSQLSSYDPAGLYCTIQLCAQQRPRPSQRPNRPGETGLARELAAQR
jgi:hypothetical protein